MACAAWRPSRIAHTTRLLAAADVAGGEHLAAALDAVVALGGIEALEAPARHDGEAQLLDDVALDRARRSPWRTARGRPAARPRCPAPASGRCRRACRAASRPCRSCRQSRWSRSSIRPWRPRPGSRRRAASAASAARRAPCSPSRGGIGMISSWVTDLAPCRNEVPMQSLPVSPPPMTMTCLPLAVICGSSRCGSPETRRFCCGRKSMAKTNAVEIAPRRLGEEVERLLGAAGEQQRVVLRPPARLAETSLPTCTLQWKTTPSASICFTRRSTMCFSILKSGMP